MEVGFCHSSYHFGGIVNGKKDYFFGEGEGTGAPKIFKNILQMKYLINI